ncbi:MAG: diguanylate cyclase [Desulfosporosinus sp.]|nr:diguanylate cyclase [Desulfosporosinus sp.]
MISNILVIDDSALDRKIIKKILEIKLPNIHVFEADDGLGINRKIIANNIHLCILDIMMPFKDGFQVLKELKEDSRLRDLPVIVCTGLEDRQTVEKALTLGAYDYFTKPLSEEAMKTSLPLKVKNAIELRKRNDEILYLSYHDFLTGLYNRRFCEEEIRRLDIKSNLPLSIIVGDINGLKLINDAFGHVNGDKLLKKAARAMQGACRVDDIVARWSGDEFIAFLPQTQEAEAVEFVLRMKELYAQEQIHGIHLSISFGWDTKYVMDKEIAKVFRNAENVMYRNKTLENESVRSKMINAIIHALHEKNPREELHSKRVSEICQALGKALRLPDIDLKKLKVAGLLHDVGKIAIEERILNKVGRLTEHECEEIKRHPAIGCRILSTSHETLELAECIGAHHEKWDGTGYPKGIQGEAIPRLARIITLADSYDAMINERPYRKALSEEEAIKEIRINSGIQFDPDLAKVFIEKVLGRRWQVSYALA